MKTFLEIRPPAYPTIAPAYEVSRALTPSQHQPNNRNTAEKNNLQITNDALRKIGKKIADKNIILHDAHTREKVQQDQFTRAKRNLAIAALMRTGEIRQITADDLLHHAQNLRDAQNGGHGPFVQVKSSPEKNFNVGV